MAATNKKVTVNVQADTKHFQVHMQQAGKSTKAFRQETQRLHGQGRLLANTFQRAANAAAVFHGPLGGISGRLSAMATSFRILNPLVIAGGAAFSGLAIGMKNGLATAIETEHQMARLAAVVEATGGASGFTAEQLDTMSRNLAMNTLASTEGVRSAAAALATFSTISGKAFKDTLSLGQDIAEVMGTDVKSATLQLAKALDAPLLGLNSLRRSGVSFTDAQREQIKVMMESGEIFKAQQVILDAVASQLEDVGVLVASETVVGAWDTLGQEVKEFWENLATTFGWADKTKTVLNTIIDLARGGKAALGEIDEQFLSEEELNSRFANLQEKLKQVDYNKLYNEDKSGTSGWFRAGTAYQQEYETELAQADRLLKEINRRKTLAAGEAEAAETAELMKAEKLRASIREAARKKQLEYDKIIAKQNQMQASSAVTIAGDVSLTAKEDARYQKQKEAFEREVELIQEKHGTILQLEEEFEQTRLAMAEEHMVRRNEALGEMRKVENKNAVADAQAARDAEEKALYEKLDAYETTSDGIASTFGTIAGAMKEGSKAQQAALVLQKAAATASLAVNFTKALGDALGSGWPQNIPAIATVTALGTAMIAQMASISVSGRANGGPVTPGGRYMVGEHGPEILQMGTGSGSVVKNSDIAPNLNVNIIEDAQRAGNVTQEGDNVQVFVAAAMNHLNEEFNSGRGLFSQMENRYGLSRT